MSAPVQEAPLSERLVYRARPTVRVDSQEFPEVSELIIAMSMTEVEGGLSSLELRVSNIASDPRGGASFAFEDDRVLKLGADIAVYAGDESAPQQIFHGTITGLEVEFAADGAPELVVLAEDAFQLARMHRRTKVHDNVSIADLAQSIAASVGLTPRITGFTDKIGTQVQLNESDLAFLRRLLARYDGDLQVVDRDFQVSPRGDVRRGAVTLTMHSQLLRVRALADLAQQVTQVTVTGWDASQGQRVSGSSSGAHHGPGSGRTGAELLSRTLGDRAHHIAHLAATTSSEAQALADAAFDERARRFVTVEATTEGNPAVRVGTHVTLSGLGDRFDNTYYVVRAAHTYDVLRGYETTFDAESAYLGSGQ